MDINKLRAEVVRKGLTLEQFAEAIDMTRPTLSNRFVRPDSFTLLEIKNIIEFLELDKEKVFDIFFN